MQAFDLDPQAAVAGRVSRIGAFRDDALETHPAGFLVKFAAVPDLVIAVVQGRPRRDI
jgi:hypothetical protein